MFSGQSAAFGLRMEFVLTHALVEIGGRHSPVSTIKSACLSKLIHLLEVGLLLLLRLDEGNMEFVGEALLVFVFSCGVP